MSETDYTDDWMNPRQTQVWTPPKPEDKMVYAINRARKEICFGDPGHIIRWDEWAKFDTAAERDAALAKLETEHPAWRLRKRDYNPYLESLKRWAC